MDKELQEQLRKLHAQAKELQTKIKTIIDNNKDGDTDELDETFACLDEFIDAFNSMSWT